MFVVHIKTDRDRNRQTGTEDRDRDVETDASERLPESPSVSQSLKDTTKTEG